MLTPVSLVCVSLAAALLAHTAAAASAGQQVLPVLVLVCDSTPAGSARVEGIMKAFNGTSDFDEYILQLDLVNLTEGDTSTLLSALLEGDPPVAIIGTPCSDTLGTFSDIVQHFHIPVISLDPLACLSEHPGHFCIQPSSKVLPDGIAAFIAHFEWNRTTIITDCGSSTILESRRLSDALMSSDVNVTNLTLANITAATDIEDLLRYTHIIAINTTPKSVIKLLCEAHSKRLSYPNYAWILPGVFPYETWELETQENMNCSVQELANALENVIILTPTASASCNDPEPYSKEDIQYNYAYDAMKTLTLALNVTLQPFTNGTTGDLHFSLMQEIANLNISGLSGVVSFSNQSRPLNHYEVLQYRKDEEGSLSLARVACISKDPPSGGSQYTLQYVCNESAATVWGQGVPPDGTPLQVENFILTPVIVVVYLTAFLGIGLAIFCMIFNFVFRKRRLIRLTSPNLNYLVCSGCFVLCASVFAFAFPEVSHLAFTVICSLRTWMACIGYDLCFGTINAKMWRVYYIFHNPHSVKKIAWKDWHLMLIVLVFVLVDVITLTVVTAIPEHRNLPVLFTDREHKSIINEQNLEVNFMITRCRSVSEVYWLSLVFGYKIVLQIVGVLLAFKIRKVKIKGLNDAREIRLLLYISSIILLTIIVVEFVSSEFINIHAVAYGFGIACATCFVLGFVFIPKVIDLYRDPKGKRVFTTQKSTTSVNASTMSGGTMNAMVTASTDTVEALEKRIAQLEMELQKFNPKED